MEEKEEGGGWIRGHLGSPGRVGSVFDERRDDQLVALPGSNMKGRVPVLVLTINVSSYTHNNMQLHIVHHSYTVYGTKKQHKTMHIHGTSVTRRTKTDMHLGILTILDEGLRAGKPPVSGCHVEGGLVVLTLSRWSQRGWRKIAKKQ